MSIDPNETCDIAEIFTSDSDLGLLKRDKKLQVRYDSWAVGIREQYGSIGGYYVRRSQLYFNTIRQ